MKVSHFVAVIGMTALAPRCRTGRPLPANWGTPINAPWLD